jgi:hypothetical protein
MKFSRLLPILLISIILLGSVSEMQAQKKIRNYNHNLSINPVAIAFSTIPVVYERQFSKNMSYTGGLAFWFPKAGNALEFSISGRYYYEYDSQVKPIKGFSFGPVARIQYWMPPKDDNDFTGDLDNYLMFNLGVEAAYKIIVDQFSFEIYGTGFFPLNGFPETPWLTEQNYNYFYLGISAGLPW